MSGTHPVTGLTAAQQQARFGSASPSPPPLPPPPRAMTSSPATASSGTGPVTGVGNGISRPPLPARPHRSTDSAVDIPTIAGGGDHSTVLDRSMTPPRPPLPPPPPQIPGAVGGTGASTASSSSAAAVAAAATSSSATGQSSGPTGGPPALKPRPPKDHEMLHGILAPNKTPATGIVHGQHGFGADMPPTVTSSSSSSRDVGGDGDQNQRHQQVMAPAPPNANSLINQLVNMGFTREQSRTALEKYDYDLAKATNHLLDWDE
ncbi:hypothetical protein EDD21DRAFT_383088 [Dissophora ornata]|nr:hypothetical protein EDD21DRAFT_383088 [Dissophora ornata]